MDKNFEALVEQCIAKLGPEKFKKEIKNLTVQADEGEAVLTIIVNEGIHPNSPAYDRGEIYVASRGNIDFSSKEVVRQEFEKILTGVARKLKEKPWKKVYLVPFGPAALSMQIKLLVYRILYIETIDYLYIGNSIYYDLHINLRTIAATSDPD